MSLFLIISPCNVTLLHILYFLFVHRPFCPTPSVYLLFPLSEAWLSFFTLSSLMRVFFYWYCDWSFFLLISIQHPYPVFFQFSYHIFTSTWHLLLTLSCIFSFVFTPVIKLANILNRNIRDFVSLYEILLNKVYQESKFFIFGENNIHRSATARSLLNYFRISFCLYIFNIELTHYKIQ